MSSHHVVREKQEPALLVLGLNDFADEMLGQLLEWSPTVIATRNTAETLQMRGIKIDYILGAGDNNISQSDVKQIDHPGGSVVQSALSFLSDNGYPSVNIITDELDISQYRVFANLINLVIFYDRKKIYPVNSGFSKWLPVGAGIQIFSLAGNLRLTGLQPIDHQRYITTRDGLFALTFNGDFIFIAEEI